LKKYVLSSATDPHCPHCRKAYSTEILDALFSKNFRKNDLRKHRIQLLMEQEKSLFSSTLLIVEREDAHNEYLNAHEIHRELLERLSPRDTTPVDTLLIVQINEIRKKLTVLTAQVHELGIDLKNQKADRKTFLHKCPSCTDGFLSSAWKCMKCKINVCNHCLAIKDPYSHMCKEEDVASAKTIKEETKPCPNCAVRVQKSEGCNQMWCTACNSAFDWKSGEKVNGPIHNPHYHDYIQGHATENPVANQWQNACENDANPASWPYIYGGHLLNLIQAKMQGRQIGGEWTQKILDINRLMIERSVSALTYRPYTPASYEDLRKKRLRSQIDDAEWSRQLSVRETCREKRNRQRLLDELLLAIGRFAFGTLVRKDNLCPQDFMEILYEPMMKARDYYNIQLESIANDNDSVKRYVNEQFILKK
jgi:hypothetical protein